MVSKKNFIIISILLSLSFLTQGIRTLAAGEFVENPTFEYYPGTQLEIEMINLISGEDYSLLLGANQLVIDQQWQNFTAQDSHMVLKVRHFDRQSLYDNASTLIERLLIELYYDDVLHDQAFLKVRQYSQNTTWDLYVPIFGTILFFLIIVFVPYNIAKIIKNF